MSWSYWAYESYISIKKTLRIFLSGVFGIVTVSLRAPKNPRYFDCVIASKEEDSGFHTNWLTKPSIGGELVSRRWMAEWPCIRVNCWSPFKIPPSLRGSMQLIRVATYRRVSKCEIACGVQRRMWDCFYERNQPGSDVAKSHVTMSFFNYNIY